MHCVPRSRTCPHAATKQSLLYEFFCASHAVPCSVMQSLVIACLAQLSFIQAWLWASERTRAVTFSAIV